MTTISSLRIQNIRSHADYQVTFSPDVTVITGANGSGKTTLLEALYIALQGSSFKGVDGDVLRSTSPWWRIDVRDHDDHRRTITFDPARPSRRKQFTIDQVTSARLLPKHKRPVILFEPDDLRLLSGSPARRRAFIDTLISKVNPLYATALRKYERALRQRNTLLKQTYVNRDELFAWDVALAEHGAYLIEQRIVFIERLNDGLNDAYDDIAQAHDDVSMHYSHTFVGDTKQKLLNELHAHYERDKILGNTSVGPHRHDVIFMLNNRPATAVASRGETRTIILALKFLEVSLVEQLSEIKPLILLDDVFSELDETRQKALSDRTRGYQIIMTSTHTLSDQPSFLHVRL